MAIVQISRIQIRRGRKNAGDIPQLASGEFGWAVDTQELYIGNGSVSEGAPFVGNTKILTEQDNLFEFAKSYSYKSSLGYIQTGETQGVPVLRSLQDRLDDIVNAKAFGAFGDGSDQTSALQRAINQLYLNPANKGLAHSRVELILDPGVYTISSTLFVPPFVTIKGAGIGKTIIRAGNHAVFKTVSEKSTLESYASESTNNISVQARNINISGISIEVNNNTAFDLVSCRNSQFKDIDISSNWDFGDGVNEDHSAILLTSMSSIVTCQDNKFENISISNFSYGIFSDYDIYDNTFENCSFDTIYESVVFGKNTVLGTLGQETGPRNNIVKGSTFNDIYNPAFVVYNGKHNLSLQNSYYDVGNHGGTSGNAQEPVIKFFEVSNQSKLDWFKRSSELSFDSRYLVNFPYVPEISGPTLSQIGYTQQVTISEQGEYAKLLKLPADSITAYSINYIYKSSQVESYRSGNIELIVDPTNNKYSISDDYNFIGEEFYDSSLKFDAATYDEDNDTIIDTVALMMINSTNNDNATLTYTVKLKS